MSNNFSYGNFNFSSLKEEEDDYAYEGEDFAPIRAFEEDSVHKLLCEGEEIPQKPLSKKEKFALKAKKNLYTSEKREIYKAEAKKVRNITKNCQWQADYVPQEEEPKEEESQIWGGNSQNQDLDTYTSIYADESLPSKKEIPQSGIYTAPPIRGEMPSLGEDYVPAPRKIFGKKVPVSSKKEAVLLEEEEKVVLVEEEKEILPIVEESKPEHGQILPSPKEEKKAEVTSAILTGGSISDPVVTSEFFSIGKDTKLLLDISKAQVMTKKGKGKKGKRIM